MKVKAYGKILVFGGYACDRTKGKVPEALRSDIDIITYQKDVEERVLSSQFWEGHTTVSQKLRVGGIEVGAVSSDEIRRINIEGLEQLYMWAGTLSPQSAAYIKTIIHGLYNSTAYGSPLDVHVADSLFQDETITLRLRRKEDGELEAILHDPIDLLVNGEGMNSVKAQLERQEEKGVYYGVALTDWNPVSSASVFIEALSVMHGAEFEDTQLPLWSINTIARSIVAVSELNIYLTCERVYSPDGKEYHISGAAFEHLWQAAYRMTHDKDVFKLKMKGEEVDVDAWFTDKVQNALARAAASEAFDAFTNVFENLPLASLFSKEMGEYFEPYYHNVGPDTSIMYKMAGIPPEAMYKKGTPEYKPEIQAVTAMLYFRNMMDKYYRLEIVQMEGISEAGEARSLDYSEYKNRPAGMSELMAMFFVSMGWNHEENQSQVQEVIHNWKPQGGLKVAWKTSDYTFDVSLHEEEVFSQMKRFEEENTIVH